MEKEKICFLIAPIGDESSIERRKLEGVLNILQKIFVGKNYRVIAANQIAEPGSIPTQIIRLLNDADIVIANLTGLNGNVMYELALRHVFKKHVIMIAEQNTKTPFDIYTERIIFFSDSFQGYDVFLSELEINIAHCMSQTNVDNPVTRAAIVDIESERKEKTLEFRTLVFEEIKNKNFIYPVVDFIDSHSVKLNSGAVVIIPNLIETTTELLVPHVTTTNSNSTLQKAFMILKNHIGTVTRIQKYLSFGRSKSLRGIMILNSDFKKEITSMQSIEVVHFDFTEKKFIKEEINRVLAIV